MGWRVDTQITGGEEVVKLQVLVVASLRRYAVVAYLGVWMMRLIECI